MQASPAQQAATQSPDDNLHSFSNPGQSHFCIVRPIGQHSSLKVRRANALAGEIEVVCARFFKAAIRTGCSFDVCAAALTNTDSILEDILPNLKCADFSLVGLEEVRSIIRQAFSKAWKEHNKTSRDTPSYSRRSRSPLPRPIEEAYMGLFELAVRTGASYETCLERMLDEKVILFEISEEIGWTPVDMIAVGIEDIRQAITADFFCYWNRANNGQYN